MPLRYLHTMVRVKDLDKSIAFYERIGFAREDIASLGRRLVSDETPQV